VNLVSGASGIIGSHVALKLLLSNRPVIACYGPSKKNENTRRLFEYYGKGDLFKQIKWVEVDLNDVFSLDHVLQEIENVFHCAGFVSFSKKDREKLYHVNEKGTENMVHACLKSGVNLCHVSSVATINNNDYKGDLTEEVFWKKSGKESDYAISKYNSEREVWRGIEEGLNAVIVNPGLVLSPGFWDQSSSKLFPAVYQGLKYYTNGKAGYVSAGDVADAMIQLMDRRKFANRYILVEGNYTYKEIFERISKCFNRNPPQKEASPGLLKLAYYLNRFISLFSGKDPRISKSMLSSAFNKQNYSSRKIIDELNFRFTPIQGEIERIASIYLQERAQ